MHNLDKQKTASSCKTLGSSGGRACRKTKNRHKMGWDIVIFNSSNKIEDFEQFDTDKLKPIDFYDVFEKHFVTIKKDGDQREIVGKDFSIDFFVDEEPVTNKMLSLSGENGLYEMVYLAKKFGWQIFDTGNGEMLDLDNPSKNGYNDFQNYLKCIIVNKQQP